MSKWQDKVGKSGNAPAAPEQPEEQGLLTLVKGIDANKNPQWAYVLIPPENFLNFRLAEAQGNYNVADYGKVLAFGVGEAPPEDVVKEMAEKYDADPDFEKKITEMIMVEMEKTSKIIADIAENKAE